MLKKFPNWADSKFVGFLKSDLGPAKSFRKNNIFITTYGLMQNILPEWIVLSARIPTMVSGKK